MLTNFCQQTESHEESLGSKIKIQFHTASESPPLSFPTTIFLRQDKKVFFSFFFILFSFCLCALATFDNCLQKLFSFLFFHRVY